MFPIAHANDGGGSIRIPASYCGLVGLKPSRGRVPRLAQSWLGAVVEGVVSRTVADSAAVLDAIAGPDHDAWYNAPAPEHPFAQDAGAGVGPLRVGLMAQAPLGIPTDENCVAAARAAAALLEELGHAVEEVEVPTISEEMVPPFIALTQGGLADYDGVDWDADRAAHPPPAQRSPARRAPTTTYWRSGSWSCSAAARWRAGAVTSTCC